MAKMILTLDGVVLKEYSITKDRTTIGRKPHNDVQIDNLAVSGEHAAVVTILNDSFLEDLGSTNGTLVNGQPVKKHFLQNADVIEIGKYKLKYLNDQPSTTTAADFEKTMVLRAPPRPSAPNSPTDTQTNFRATGTGGVKQGGPTDTQINAQKHATQTNINTPALAAATAGLTNSQIPTGFRPQAAPAAPAPAASAGQQGTIQILSGPNAGRELPLSKALTTLGKPGVQVAVIAKRPQGFFITHVEGTSFPVVNGKALDAQAHLLNDHDVIELAGVKMEFFFKSDA